MGANSQLPQAKRWQDLSKAEQKQISMHLQSVAQSEPVKAPKRARGTFELRGYVRCELSSADKEAFRLWEELQTADSLYQALVKAADSGYLFKVGANKEGFQASFCASDTGSSWDGMVLTAHAGNSGRAIALLVYKHEILMQGDWAAFNDEGGEDFFR